MTTNYIRGLYPILTATKGAGFINIEGLIKGNTIRILYNYLA